MLKAILAEKTVRDFLKPEAEKMRINHNMLHNTVLKDITNNFRQISKLHEQGSSGLKVRYPSDDAVVATRASNIGNRLREIQQYKRNGNTVESILSAYDTTTQEIGALTFRLRELVVQGANDVLTKDDRAAVAQGISKIKEHLVQLANTSVGGQFIYGGASSDSAPVDENGEIIMPAKSDKKLTVDLGGYNFEYSYTVYDAFVVEGNESVFNLLDNIVANLENDNPEVNNNFENFTKGYLNDIALQKLDRFERNLQTLTARNGSSGNFLTMATKRFTDFEGFMTEYLSKEQDADFLEVYTKLQNQQSVLEAGLKTGGNIMMLSLVDFMG